MPLLDRALESQSGSSPRFVQHEGTYLGVVRVVPPQIDRQVCRAAHQKPLIDTIVEILHPAARRCTAIASGCVDHLDANGVVAPAVFIIVAVVIDKIERHHKSPGRYCKRTMEPGSFLGHWISLAMIVPVGLAAVDVPGRHVVHNPAVHVDGRNFQRPLLVRVKLINPIPVIIGRPGASANRKSEWDRVRRGAPEVTFLLIHRGEDAPVTTVSSQPIAFGQPVVVQLGDKRSSTVVEARDSRHPRQLAIELGKFWHGCGGGQGRCTLGCYRAGRGPMSGDRAGERTLITDIPVDTLNPVPIGRTDMTHLAGDR